MPRVLRVSRSPSPCRVRTPSAGVPSFAVAPEPTVHTMSKEKPALADTRRENFSKENSVSDLKSKWESMIQKGSLNPGPVGSPLGLSQSPSSAALPEHSLLHASGKSEELRQMQAPKGTKVLQAGGGGPQVNPALPPRGGGGPPLHQSPPLQGGPGGGQGGTGPGGQGGGGIGRGMPPLGSAPLAQGPAGGMQAGGLQQGMASGMQQPWMLSARKDALSMNQPPMQVMHQGAPGMGAGIAGRPGVGGGAAQALPAAMQPKQNPAFQPHAAQQRGAEAAAAAAAEVAGGGSAAAAHSAPPQSLTPFQNTLPKHQAAAAAAAAATAAAGGGSAAAAHSAPAALPVNISDGRRQFLTISTDADLYAQSHTNLNAEAHTQARDANSVVVCAQVVRAKDIFPAASQEGPSADITERDAHVWEIYDPVKMLISPVNSSAHTASAGGLAEGDINDLNNTPGGGTPASLTPMCQTEDARGMWQGIPLFQEPHASPSVASDTSYWSHDPASELTFTKMLSVETLVMAPIEEAPERPLPPGWEKAFDGASRRTFYVNHDLRAFSWEPVERAKDSQEENSSEERAKDSQEGSATPLSFTLSPHLSPHVLATPTATTATTKEIASDSTTPLQPHASVPSIPAEHSAIILPCGTRFEQEAGLVKGEAKKLARAARHGDTANVRTLLSTPAAQFFINYQDELGGTPLHIAAFNGHSSVTELLIAAQCNVDLQTKKGDTPLHIAAFNGHALVAEQLLAARCNVHLQNGTGCTPLHSAALNGHASITSQLLAATCNVDLQERNGPTALHMVSGAGFAPVVEQLFATRAHVGIPDNGGNTPLHLAALYGHAAVTEQLIAARCNVDLQSNDGSTPLYLAALIGHASVTEQLLAARCNVDLQTKDCRTALQIAQLKGHAGIATMIRSNAQQAQAAASRDTVLTEIEDDFPLVSCDDLSAGGLVNAEAKRLTLVRSRGAPSTERVLVEDDVPLLSGDGCFFFSGGGADAYRESQGVEVWAEAVKAEAKRDTPTRAGIAPCSESVIIHDKFPRVSGDDLSADAVVKAEANRLTRAAPSIEMTVIDDQLSLLPGHEGGVTVQVKDRVVRLKMLFQAAGQEGERAKRDSTTHHQAQELLTKAHARPNTPHLPLDTKDGECVKDTHAKSDSTTRDQAQELLTKAHAHPNTPHLPLEPEPVLASPTNCVGSLCFTTTPCVYADENEEEREWLDSLSHHWGDGAVHEPEQLLMKHHNDATLNFSLIAALLCATSQHPSVHAEKRGEKEGEFAREEEGRNKMPAMQAQHTGESTHQHEGPGPPHPHTSSSQTALAPPGGHRPSGSPVSTTPSPQAGERPTMRSPQRSVPLLRLSTSLNEQTGRWTCSLNH